MGGGAGLKPRSRRSFLGALAALGATACTGTLPFGPHAGEAILPRATPEGIPDDLLALAGRFVAIAERGRSAAGLWGRLGGSPAESEAGQLLADALAPLADRVVIEHFPLRAIRPQRWSLAIAGRAPLASAMPAPVDALFPPEVVAAPVTVIDTDDDWERAAGSWVYVAATMKGTPALNSVRDGKLYERAVRAGARGFVFSLPTPPGVWRLAAPVDKAFALADSQYPDGRRPIPAFCVDADDGALIAAAGGATLTGSAVAGARDDWPAANVVARIEGELPATVAVMSHLDSFFSGANDNASGLATLVGLARRIHAARRAGARTASFVLVGLAAHHDGGAGMRAFQTHDSARFASLAGIVLIEHTDAVAGHEVTDPGWPATFDDKRQAFLGPAPWPAVEAALPELVSASGLMPLPPATSRACISDLLVVCDRLPTFSLIQAPPYYHTDHDTLDKISAAGLERAVDFHVRLLERTGFVVR